METTAIEVTEEQLAQALRDAVANSSTRSRA